MKPALAILAFLVVCISCKQKVLSGKELEDKLKETMSDHLRKTLQPDVTFKITDLIYYPDQIKKHYNCTFKVEIHGPAKDTVGEMKALIPNDFSKVDRIQ